jgi:SAM-dependent methyltransferase
MTGHDQAHPAHHVHFDSPEMVARAELEGEVLVDVVQQAATRLAARHAATGSAVTHVLEIGCGPGVGTCVLAERFETAQVVAVDGAPAMIERARERVARLGLGGRVEIRRVELPAGLDTLAPADVVFASMVLHHVGDEVDAFRRLGGLLRPGGLLAIVERAGPVRVVGDGVDAGRPGLWERLDEASERWFAVMRADLPGSVPSEDYRAMVEAAGLEVVVDELLSVDLTPPLDEPTSRFVIEQLRGTSTKLASHADPADLAALDQLATTDADTTDLQVRATRQLLIARVP